jgi:hypothetical protein
MVFDLDNKKNHCKAIEVQVSELRTHQTRPRRDPPRKPGKE